MLRRRDQTVRSLRVEHYSSAVNRFFGISIETVRESLDTYGRWPSQFDELTDLDYGCEEQHSVHGAKLVRDPEAVPALRSQRFDGSARIVSIEIEMPEFLDDGRALVTKKCEFRQVREDICVTVLA